MKIEINDELFDQIKCFLDQTSFTRIQDLVQFILEDYLEQNKEATRKSDSDENQLNNRLKDLGYL